VNADNRLLMIKRIAAFAGSLEDRGEGERSTMVRGVTARSGMARSTSLFPAQS